MAHRITKAREAMQWKQEASPRLSAQFSFTTARFRNASTMPEAAVCAELTAAFVTLYLDVMVLYVM